MEPTRIKIEQKFDHLFFLGDIHGDYHCISYYLKDKDLFNCLIYQVGDFGVGFDPNSEKLILNQVNNILRERNSKVIVIRGNHDNPEFFGEMKHKFSNIDFLSDYTISTVIINQVEQNILGIGGAISIDRTVKEKKGYYFKDEKANSITDPAFLNSIKNINIIVTHTSPDFVFPFRISQIVEEYALTDKTLKGELTQERQQLGNMINYLIGVNSETLTHYFYGHFHKNSREEYKDVKFECLDINQFRNL